MRRRALVVSFWVLFAVMGAMRAWDARYALNPDGMSYLDMGTAFFDGDRSALVNGHWSPAYPFLLGLVQKIANPPMEQRYAVVQVANLLVLLFELAAFQFMLSGLVERVGSRSALTRWGWTIVGYSLLGWATFDLITPSLVSPDLLVSGILYLSVGQLLRMGSGGVRAFVLLGLTLGIGYLVKAPFFPLAAPMLLLAWSQVIDRRRAIPALLAGCAVFAATVMPQVVALSLRTGQLTFGESGRLNYAWHVDGVREYAHWQGGDHGVAIHPTRILRVEPSIYEFGQPVGGSYPVWYDPSYWHRGIQPRLEFSNQARVLRANGREILHLLFGKQEILAIGFGLLLLFAAVRGAGTWARSISAFVPLLVPAVLGLSMFAVVLVLGRYAAPFLLLTWLGLLGWVSLSTRAPDRRLFRFAIPLLAAVLLWRTVAGFVERDVDATARGDDLHVTMARAVGRLGVEAKMPLAITGPGFAAYWVQLAGARLVAELPESRNTPIWSMDVRTRDEILETLHTTGARFLAHQAPPAPPEGLGWQRAGETPLYLLRLGS